MKKLLFIFLILSFCNLFSQQENCSEFKTGKFKYLDSKLNDWVIFRTDSLQTESDPESGIIIISSINWITECHYILTYKEIHNYPGEDIVGETIDVKITSINNNIYTCHVVSDVADNYIKIYKIE